MGTFYSRRTSVSSCDGQGVGEGFDCAAIQNVTFLVLSFDGGRPVCVVKLCQPNNLLIEYSKEVWSIQQILKPLFH